MNKVVPAILASYAYISYRLGSPKTSAWSATLVARVLSMY